MLNDDQYMERTPDLVGKIRKLRESVEKERNRFTRVADYDVRRVVGKKPKALASPDKADSPSHTGEATKTLAIAQPSIEPSPAPTERGDEGGCA